MNARERVLKVIAGEIPDRVPVCLHNFLPAAREAGIPMAEYRSNPESIARAHLLAYEKLEQWNPGGRFILNAGCAIPAGTPPENIHALVQSASEFGLY